VQPPAGCWPASVGVREAVTTLEALARASERCCDPSRDLTRVAKLRCLAVSVGEDATGHAAALVGKSRRKRREAGAFADSAWDAGGKNTRSGQNRCAPGDDPNSRDGRAREQINEVVAAARRGRITARERQLDPGVGRSGLKGRRSIARPGDKMEAPIVDRKGAMSHPRSVSNYEFSEPADLLALVEPNCAAVDRARGVYDAGRYQSGVGGPGNETRCARERVRRTWPSSPSRPGRTPGADRPLPALQVPNRPGCQLPLGN